MKNGGVSTSAKYIAYIAVMTALLIGSQYALGFVAGIEIVTALLLCFSAYFGVACGVLTAVSFSLLRCFIWGIYPSVLILYLIYYPLFALVFGLLGKVKSVTNAGVAIAVNAILTTLAAASLCCALFDLIKISKLYKTTLTVCLYVIAGICIAACLAFNIIYALARRGKFDGEKTLRLFLLTAVAAVCTACFTLLDDIISPLFAGMSSLTALTYFYASFTAMLPQIICTVATVPALYFPVTFALTKACPKSKLN